MSKKVKKVIKSAVDMHDWSRGYKNGLKEAPYNPPRPYPGTGNKKRDMERNGNYVDGYSKGARDIGRE